MNRLKLDIRGGMPLHQEDIRFLDDSFRQAFTDISRSLLMPVEAAILWGCNIAQVSSGYSVSEGSIFYQNEVWHVTPHTMPSPIPMPDEPRWRFSSIPGPEGSRTFFNGESHNVHLIRQAVLSLATVNGETGSINVSMLPRLDQLDQSIAILTPIVSNGVVERSGRTTPNRVSKNKNMIFFDAAFTVSLGNNSVQLCTVPEGFRPVNFIEQITVGISSLLNEEPFTSLMLSILPDGRVYIQRMRTLTQGNTSVSFAVTATYII
jgi:hypothetical protein